MIFISPQGITIGEWFTEIRRRNYARARTRKKSEQKRTERDYARKPLFGRARTFFKRILSTGRKTS